MLQYLTCGESHGEYLLAILEGMPSGLKVDLDAMTHELKRRQQGYGRGGRMKIESDEVRLVAGFLKGKTTGAPLGFLLQNSDFRVNQMEDPVRPRPGHADLAGALKYNSGIRAILERASARETVMRVAMGAVCRQLLAEFDIDIVSHVVQIGGVCVAEEVKFDEIRKKTAKSQLNCTSSEAEKKMIQSIAEVMKSGDTVGGQFELRAKGVPIGLGSHVHYKRKFDARIAQALMSIQSVKAVELGLGIHVAEKLGSEAHDEIFFDKTKGYFRKTNRSGGTEGGMTNGNELLVRVSMKPIATLRKPLQSVDMKTKKPMEAHFERSDVCHVPAGGVIGEAVLAYELADTFLEKFGGDSIDELKRNYDGYLTQLKKS